MHTMKTTALEVIEHLPDTVDIDEIIKELQRFRLRTSVSQTKPVSFLEAAKQYIGCVEGPEDLSTNKEYFKDFGR